MQSLTKNHYTELEIPIILRNLPTNMIVTDPSPNTLEVFVEGKGLDIYKLTKINAYIDIDAQNFEIGNNEVNVTDYNIIINEPILKNSLVFHLNMMVEFHFDIIASKDVDIIPRFLTLDDELYFQQHNAKLSVQKARIEGPKKLINNLNSITTTPITKEIMDDSEITVELEIPENVIGIKPDAVSIVLETSTYITKTIPLIQIEFPPQENYQIIPQYVTVKIEGIDDFVYNIGADMIRAYVNIPSDYEYDFADISFQLPEGIHLVEYTPRRVHIIQKDNELN